MVESTPPDKNVPTFASEIRFFLIQSFTLFVVSFLEYILLFFCRFRSKYTSLDKIKLFKLNLNKFLGGILETPLINVSFSFVKPKLKKKI